MKLLNCVKKENAAVLLADGFEIGNQQAGGLSYKELSGLLGNLLAGIRSHRQQWLADIENNTALPIPPCDPNMMNELVAKVANNPRSQKAASKKKSNGGSEDDDDAGDEQDESDADNGLGDQNFAFSDGEEEDEVGLSDSE
jgi:hypothetical protein